jgi:site-specific DNA-methyltransferase (adenine-specific)
MPSSAKDRFTVDFEYLFFFVKNKKYWFEQQFEPHLSPVTNKIVGRKGTDVQQSQGDPNGYHAYGEQGRNKRTVWTIPTKPYPEAHFAVYPAELIRTCIKAGCPKYGVVLDPFAGSGTTLEEAIRQGKDYIGIELKDDYIDLIEKRLSKVQVSLI